MSEIQDDMKMVNLSQLEDEVKLRQKLEMENKEKDLRLVELKAQVAKLEEEKKKLSISEHYHRVKCDVLEDIQEKLIDKIR